MIITALTGADGVSSGIIFGRHGANRESLK